MVSPQYVADVVVIPRLHMLSRENRLLDQCYGPTLTKNRISVLYYRGYLCFLSGNLPGMLLVLFVNISDDHN